MKRVSIDIWISYTAFTKPTIELLHAKVQKQLVCYDSHVFNHYIKPDSFLRVANMTIIENQFLFVN